MTPQERQLIDDLFGRLERLETAPRDAEAESAIMAGLRRAPNAVYALVQTALLQDEALKHAAERIKQLEAGETPQNQGSFLDSLRGSLFGENTNMTASRGSVPNVPPSNPNTRPVWNSGQVLGQTDGTVDPRGAPGGYAQPGYGAQQGGGSSFLGTAAAAAAGMIGGSILMNSLRGLGGLGGGQQQSFGGSSASPWGGGGNNNDSLARDAGINDIGKSNSGGIEDRRQSFADQAQDAQQDRDDDQDQDQDQDDDDGDFDDGDFGSDDSDFA